MAENDDKPDRKLISELDSLAELLEDSGDSNPIPVLNKVIDDQRSQVIPTLDRVMEAASPQAPESEQEDFTLDILIQEVIDEFMPEIEAELRKRLLNAAPDTLQALLESLRKR